VDQSPSGKKKHRLLVFLFFSIYFLVGLSIYRDYGISVDETLQRDLGMASLDYVMSGDYSPLLFIRNADHGPAFQVFLQVIEKLLKLEDTQEIYLMRHLVTFLLFFVAVYFFYLLCRVHFDDDRVALLGALALILSPRIFADSFYNPKDLPFLSLFIISMYTLIRLLDTKSFLAAAAHAFACALLIDIRITGVVMVAITLFANGVDLTGFTADGRRLQRTVKLMAVYLAVLIPCVILFWPFLWHNPLGNFIHSFRSMSHFRWRRFNLYLGNYIQGGTPLPWHYIPLWLIITTPLLYVFLFFVGLSTFLAGFIKKPLHYISGDQKCRREVLFFLCFSLPLAAVIALHSVLYNGWRQMFFIYPAFLLISMSGSVSIYAFLRRRFDIGPPILHSLFAFVIVISCSSVAYSMITNHPLTERLFQRIGEQ
jgi:hypothetical protein